MDRKAAIFSETRTFKTYLMLPDTFKNKHYQQKRAVKATHLTDLIVKSRQYGAVLGAPVLHERFNRVAVPIVTPAGVITTVEFWG